MSGLPGIQEIRKIMESDINRVAPGVLRLMNPHRWYVSRTEKLWKLKQELVKG